MMTPEIWGVVAAILLGIAAAAGGIALFRAQGHWAKIAAGARAAGTAAVAIALGLSVMVQGEWSPFEIQHVMLGLVLAMLCIQMVLSWRLGLGSGGPVVDVVAVALILVERLMIWPDSMPLDCAQQSVALGVQWVLLLLGGGATLVAGSAGLTLALRKGLAGRGMSPQQPQREELYNLLIQAISLALVALGSGLTVSVWWAWRTVGTLTCGDPRDVWMAIAWLVAAMSRLAWHLTSHRGRWASGLALVAATCVVFCLVFLAQFQGLLGV